MKISISNIAWNSNIEEDVLCLLQKNGIKYVEIAPTKICDWEDFDLGAFTNFVEKLSKFGLSISNIQSIFYNKNINIFDNFAESIQHINKIIDLAKFLKAENIIFGSPKNRISKNYIDDEKKFITLLDVIDEKLKHTKIMFNIESNPIIYNCNFLTEPSQVQKFLFGRTNIGFHLDTACVEYSQENIAGLANIDVNSVHISEMNLQNFNNPLIEHQKYRKILKDKKYCGILSIEMRETNLESIERAINFVNNLYILEK